MKIYFLKIFKNFKEYFVVKVICACKECNLHEILYTVSILSYILPDHSYFFPLHLLSSYMCTCFGLLYIYNSCVHVYICCIYLLNSLCLCIVHNHLISAYRIIELTNLFFSLIVSIKCILLNVNKANKK